MLGLVLKSEQIIKPQFQDIIDASKSHIDVWINDHYDELVKGMICSNALVCKLSDMKDKNFQLSIKDKCDRKQKRIDGKRVGVISSKMNVKVCIIKQNIMMRNLVMINSSNLNQFLIPRMDLLIQK